MEEKPRIAASSYLNTAPLIWSFAHGSRKGEVELIEAVPARCADLLLQTKVEVSLVPIIEYQRMAGILVVPNICVGSRGRVRSVVLVSTFDDLKKIRSVAIDESSRTSATLIKIVFREFLGFEPRWTTHSPDLKRMLRENDAALIIGDPAMSILSDEVFVWDMASLWQEFTGLGFIFAMWMAREEAREQLRTVDFAAARDEGLARTEEIASYYENEIPLSREEIKHYLTENIAFRIDDAMAKGLQLYFELARANMLIDKMKPLQFVELE